MKWWQRKHRATKRMLKSSGKSFISYSSHTLTKDTERWMRYGQDLFPEARPRYDIPWQRLRKKYYSIVSLTSDDNIQRLYNMDRNKIRSSVERKILEEISSENNVPVSVVSESLPDSFDDTFDRMMDKMLLRIQKRYETDALQNRELRMKQREFKKKMERDLKIIEKKRRLAELTSVEDYRSRDYKSMSLRGLTGSVAIKTYWSKRRAFSEWF